MSQCLYIISTHTRSLIDIFILSKTLKESNSCTALQINTSESIFSSSFYIRLDLTMTRPSKLARHCK